MDIDNKTNISPIIRNALDAGFDEVRILDKKIIQFLKDGIVIKQSSENELLDLKLTIKGNSNYKWISDVDSSSKRFHNFLFN